jgi:hypothetical protein
MKSLRFPALALILGGFGLLSSGCTTTSYDVQIDALWTISGGTPTLGACSQAGISEVELVIYDNPSATVVRRVFTSYCEDGGFVTGYTLPYGYYYYQWTGYDRDGNPIQESSILDLDARFDTLAQLPIVDFDPPPTSIQVNVYWDTGAAYGTCASAVVDDGMDYYLVNPNTGGYVVTAENVGCADTIFIDYEDDGWAPTRLSYDVDIYGYATDLTQWQGTCTIPLVTLGANNIVDCYADILP